MKVIVVFKRLLASGNEWTTNMAAIYSNGSNRWNILGFNFTKRDALSSVYKISMILTGKWYIDTVNKMATKSIDILYTLDSASNYSAIKKMKPWLQTRDIPMKWEDSYVFYFLNRELKH
jgi:hypothetical protein